MERRTLAREREEAALDAGELVRLQDVAVLRAAAGWRKARGHLGPLRGSILELPPTTLTDDLPLAVEGRVGLLAGDAVVELVSRARKPR